MLCDKLDLLYSPHVIFVFRLCAPQIFTAIYRLRVPYNAILENSKGDNREYNSENVFRQA